MPSKDLVFRFLSVDAGGGAGFDRMAGKAGMVHSAFDKLAVGAAAAGLGLAAASVKMAGDFQQSTNLLVTAAGESQRNLALIRKGVLDISASTGTATGPLLQGMYQIEKAGIRGADGLKVLRAAAQGALEENANLGTVTNAMTSIMASYHIGASRSVGVMNALKTAAGSSKTTMEDFAGSLSTVLPVASAAGVSFAQVGGAIAGLTRHGTSAFEATQELANTIRNLQAPSKIAVKTMQQFGISAVDVSRNLGKRGVAGTLEYLVDVIGKHMGPSGLVLIDTFKHAQYATADMTTMLRHMTPEARKLTDELLNNTVTLKGYRTEAGRLPADQAIMARQFANLEVQSRGFSDALKSGLPQATTMSALLKQMLGGSVGLNTALQLTGANQAYVNETTKRTAASLNDNGKQVEGFASTLKLGNVQWNRFIRNIDNLGIGFGTKLMPKLIEVGNWFADHKKVVEDFGELVAVGLAAKFAILAGKLAVSPLVGILKLMRGVGGGGAATSLGGIVASTKPIPVFVTNEGFGGKGGGPGGFKKAAENDIKKAAENPAVDAAAGAAGEKAAEKFGVRAAAKAAAAKAAERVALGAAVGGPASWALLTKGDSGVPLTPLAKKRHDNIVFELTYLLDPKGIKDFPASVYPKNNFDPSRATSFLLQHNPSKQEVAYLKELGTEFPAVAAAVRGYEDRLDRATDATDRLKSASSQARGAALAHKVALAAAKLALDNESDSIGHMKSQITLARAAEIAHANAVRIVVGQLKNLPGAYAQAAAQARRGGMTIGQALDDGMTVAINQHSGKATLAFRQVVNGVVIAGFKAADSHSPSRKTMYLGQMLAEGLIAGFNSVSARMLHMLPIPIQGLLEDMRTKIKAGLATMSTTVKTATARLKADIGARNSLAASIASGWQSYADISGAYDQTAGNPTDLAAFLTGRLNTMRTLDTDLSRLGKMGLSGGLIKQLASMQPDQGLQFASSILAGNGGGVRNLNSLWAQISKATSHASMTAANAVMGPQIAADRRAVAHAERQRDRMIVLLEALVRKAGMNPDGPEIRRELLALKRTLGGNLGLA